MQTKLNAGKQHVSLDVFIENSKNQQKSFLGSAGQMLQTAPLGSGTSLAPQEGMQQDDEQDSHSLPCLFILKTSAGVIQTKLQNISVLN